MRHRLTFQRPIETSDGTGAGGTITWTDAFTAWAERWSVKGAERVEAARVRENAIHRWHLRYDARIQPSMRIKWIDGGFTHYQEVVAVNLLGNDRRELEVMAEEKI